MSRNFGVEMKPVTITESDCRMIRNLSIVLAVVAAVLLAMVVA